MTAAMRQMNRRAIVRGCCKSAATDVRPSRRVQVAGIYRSVDARQRRAAFMATSDRGIAAFFGSDRRAVDDPSALVSDADPAVAMAEFGAGHQKLPRQFVGRRDRPDGRLEQHSSRVQNNIMIEEQVEEETRHIMGTMNDAHG
jgi:hypothetical protein